MDASRALDTVITNALIVDHTGIYKADIGIKDGMIVGIGKAGNPDVMKDVTPGMIVGVNTEAIAGEGSIITAGGLDTTSTSSARRSRRRRSRRGSPPCSAAARVQRRDVRDDVHAVAQSRAHDAAFLGRDSPELRLHRQGQHRETGGVCRTSSTPARWG